MYITQIQKDIKNTKPLFRRYINLGIGIQAFKKIKLLFTKYTLVHTAK